MDRDLISLEIEKHLGSEIKEFACGQSYKGQRNQNLWKFSKSNCDECFEVAFRSAVFAVKPTWAQIPVQLLASCLPLESSPALQDPGSTYVEWEEYIILDSLLIWSYISLLIKSRGRLSEKIENQNRTRHIPGVQ